MWDGSNRSSWRLAQIDTQENIEEPSIPSETLGAHKLMAIQFTLSSPAAGPPSLTSVYRVIPWLRLSKTRSAVGRRSFSTQVRAR